MNMARDSQRAVPTPCKRGLSRVESAGYIGVSPNTFDRLVSEGQMPNPKRVGTRKIWDARVLGLAFEALPTDDFCKSEINEWDEVLQ